ncbi:uncharacterized protein CELE_F58B6.11 [Caenorhabditis elegans]|nr:Uncharacterized protein CELE_F58B6.11 [Caenorhabditis elegans]CAH2662231.1 Uncharacterized protein CELE_F58B6.11 [Caenorhabditis elegans]
MSHKRYTIDEASEVMKSFNQQKYVDLRESSVESDRMLEEMLEKQKQLVWKSVRIARISREKDRAEKTETLMEEVRFFWSIEMQCRHAVEDWKRRKRENDRKRRTDKVVTETLVQKKRRRKVEEEVEEDQMEDRNEDRDEEFDHGEGCSGY